MVSQSVFIFVILELKTWFVIHSAVTRSPTDEWAGQQLREATLWGYHPKYPIRDHDRKYGSIFSSVATGSGIQEVKTHFQVPKANAICERFIGSVKRECLDHMLVLNQRHWSTWSRTM
jgi:putative transposase